MTKLGMVIINYNDYSLTKRLLDNIKDYKVLNLIVIVDNASTDNSYERLKKEENNKIVVIQAKENKGYAAGLNLGAKYVIKKLGKCNIVFSNSDIIINSEEDLKRLNKDIGKHNIGLVGPTIVEDRKLNRGWMMPSIKDEIKFNLPLISRKYKKKILYDEEHYNEDLSIVGVVSGCFFCVSGEVLKKVKYFDEKTFLYYEEQILSKKLEDIDSQVAVDNNVVIVHDHSMTIDKNVGRIKKYKALKTSQQYFVDKYLKATKKELRLLKITNKLSLFILYIRCFFSKIFNKKKILRTLNIDERLATQIFRFVVVGGIATVIDFVSIFVFKEFVGLHVLVANTIAFTIATIYNYIASISWVFDVKKEKKSKKSFILFVLFSLIGLGINNTIIWLLDDFFGIYYMISKVIATCFVMVFNFITRKKFLE